MSKDKHGTKIDNKPHHQRKVSVGKESEFDRLGEELFTHEKYHHGAPGTKPRPKAQEGDPTATSTTSPNEPGEEGMVKIDPMHDRDVLLAAAAAEAAKKQQKGKKEPKNERHGEGSGGKHDHKGGGAHGSKHGKH